MIEQIRAVAKEKIYKKIASVDDVTLSKIDRGLKLLLSLV